MLLKCTTAEKRARASGVPAKGKLCRGTAMKMTMSTGSTMTPRVHRKVLRVANKRYPGKVTPGKLTPGKAYPGKSYPGKLQAASKGKGARPLPRPVDPCDNSNDSGFGFDQHLEFQLHRNTRFAESNQDSSWIEERPEEKRRKLEIKIEADDANDNFTFPETATPSKVVPPLPIPSKSIGRVTTKRSPPMSGPITLSTQLGSMSQQTKAQLQILCQPEQQHRARYQTEGSRGAVKDRNGHGFPIVKLVGYSKPAVLQVFIGTDLGRVAPHMFYQACRVSGKNSTPCSENKVEGTIVIEVQLEPTKDMTVTCDCVGILKERNVDVEHRFPEQSGPRSKKKSTRCRMVFRTVITHDDNTTETLQICSQPIVCTQPPGVPEICKKSLTSCPVTGGLEMFILGKNFSKDTQVVFQKCRNNDGENEVLWEESVIPDKEFMQQTHLVCAVPAYPQIDITESEPVRVFVMSCGKTSEPHNFLYTPMGERNVIASATTTVHSGLSVSGDAMTHLNGHFMSEKIPRPVMMWTTSDIKPKSELDMDMMPPPAPMALQTLTVRRPSTTGLILPDQHSPPLLKSEAMDESSQGSESSFQINNENSMDIHHSDSMDNMGIQRHKLMRLANENSMDVLHSESSNMSTIVNENSMDAMRSNNFIHNKDSRSMSNMQQISTITSQMMPQAMITDSPISPNMNAQLSPAELKVIDLRVKPSDLAQTQSPSMATLRHFVTDSRDNPLPRQTGQSVENYLSNLETDVAKSVIVTNMLQPTSSMQPTLSQQIQIQAFNQLAQAQSDMIKTDQMIESVTAAMFNTQPTQNSSPGMLFGQQSNIGSQLNQMVPSVSQMELNQLNQLMPSQEHNSNLLPTGTNLTKQYIEQTIANNLSVTMANNLLSESQSNQPNLRQMLTKEAAMAIDSANSSMQRSLVELENNLLNTTPATVKLDALVNSTVDTHMRNPQTVTSLGVSNNGTDDIIMQQSSLLNQSLSSQSQSPNSSNILPTHANVNTTITQDILLNSQQVPPMNHNEMMLSNNSSSSSISNSPPGHMSPDIILNPQVSPSVMCQSGITTESLLNNTVAQQALDNQMLNAALNLNAQESMLTVSMNSIINNTPMGQQAQSDNMHMSNVIQNAPSNMVSPTHKTPQVAVKNMILNAAAEILTSQQAATADPSESTISAFVTSAINTVLNENASSAQPMIITQAPSVPQAELQQQTDQQRISDALCQPNPVSAMDQRMNEIFGAPAGSSLMMNQAESNVIANNVHQMLNVEMNTQSQALLNNVTMPNMVDNIVSQMNDNKNNVATSYMSNGNQYLSAQNNQALNVNVMPSQLISQEVRHVMNQELQMTAVPNEFIQNVTNEVVGKTAQFVTNEIRNVVNQELRAAENHMPQQGNITHDLNAMSDNALINYINPSCFDQIPLQ